MTSSVVGGTPSPRGYCVGRYPFKRGCIPATPRRVSTLYRLPWIERCSPRKPARKLGASDAHWFIPGTFSLLATVSPRLLIAVLLHKPCDTCRSPHDRKATRGSAQTHPSNFPLWLCVLHLVPSIVGRQTLRHHPPAIQRVAALSTMER